MSAHATATTDYAAVTGSAQSFTVSAATPTIRISSLPTNAEDGGKFTVAYTYSGNGSPTESVSSSTTSVCTVSGNTVSFVGVGTCSLTANATATTDYTAASGSVQSFTVTAATTTILLTSSVNPSSYDQPVVFSAAVSSPGTAPAGTVLFYDGSTEIGSGTILNGNAALDTSTLSVGTHSIKAVYQGSSTDEGSTSAVLSQVVKAAATTTTATLAPPNAYPMEPVVVTIGVTDTVGAYPTGTVNCSATGTSQTFSASLSDGGATWTLTDLSAGTYKISCAFAGSADFAASTASPVTEMVAIPAATWATSASFSKPTYFQTATLLGNGTVLIAGGSTGNGDEGAQSSAQIYAPGMNGTGTYNPTGQMTDARFGHTANVISTGLQSGQVLVAGGENYLDTQLSEAELYDYTSNSFSVSPVSLNTPRSMHTATTLQDGTIMFAGGYTGCVSCGETLLGTAEIYTPELLATNQSGVTSTQPASFTVVGSLNTPRAQHTATLLYNGMVLIAGGRNSDNNAIASAELYNPATRKFTPTGSLNTARADHIAILLPNGNVLIAGGEAANGNPTASAELYNPATGTFTATGNMTTARYYPSGALLNNGKVLIYGGGVNDSSASAAATSSAEIYNPTNGTFTVTTSLNTARYFATTMVLPNGNVLAMSGLGTGGSILSGSEVYSPNNTITGVINPKYMIMGITYAPPGAASTVSYTNTDLVSNTTDITSSTAQSEGISATIGAGIGGGAGGGGGNQGGVSVVQGWVNESTSGTAGYTWTQTNQSENSFTTSQQSSNGYVTPGTANYFSPVDHDYDIIWLWINPTIVLTVDMDSPNGSPVWNGYGYDAFDPANGMDVIPVQVGNLNGDLPAPDITNALARNWAAEEGLYWPNGDVPGLSATDYANILAADPFTNPNYTVVLPNTGTAPLTTTDGRFTQAMSTNGTAESIRYLQENGTSQLKLTYGETYATTTTSSQTASNSNKVSWGITDTFKGSFFGVAAISYGVTYSGSVTIENSTKTSVTNTDTQATVVTIEGPPCAGNPCSPSYSGIAPAQPALFDVYQDNLFGGLMYFGVN